VVDPALLRQAADRGVTICFADLDGADGLWVPEERTVLVSRRLSEREVAEVIEHELTHVAIDDQHADLDAGREVVIGGGPGRPSRSRGWAAALTGSALIAVVGGVSVGLALAADDTTVQDKVVAPTPDGPGLTAEESGAGRPTVITTPSMGPDGRVVVITITLTATPSLPVVSTLVEASTTAAPRTTVTRVVPPPAGPSVTGQGQPTASPTAVVTSAPVTTTAPAPTEQPTEETEPDPVPNPGAGGGEEEAGTGTEAVADSAVPGTSGITD
jgi:hypothetical protein